MVTKTTITPIAIYAQFYAVISSFINWIMQITAVSGLYFFQA